MQAPWLLKLATDLISHPKTFIDLGSGALSVFLLETFLTFFCICEFRCVFKKIFVTYGVFHSSQVFGYINHHVIGKKNAFLLWYYKVFSYPPIFHSFFVVTK